MLQITQIKLLTRARDYGSISRADFRLFYPQGTDLFVIKKLLEENLIQRINYGVWKLTEKGEELIQ